MQWYYQYIREEILSLNNFSLTIILLLSLHAISYYTFYLFSFVVCNLRTFVCSCAVTVTGVMPGVPAYK